MILNPNLFWRGFGLGMLALMVGLLLIVILLNVLFRKSRRDGVWPESCAQRAFVEGAAWWQWKLNGSTMFASERDEAETEAVRRYGDPMDFNAAEIQDDHDFNK